MSEISFKFEGLSKIKQNLAKVVSETPKKAARGLYAEALIEEKESRRRTPVEWGTLKGSHKTNPPEIKGRDISVSITVGGPAGPGGKSLGYALPVHENLEVFHHVGQAEFLRSTLRESARYMAFRIAKRLGLG